MPIVSLAHLDVWLSCVLSGEAWLGRRQGGEVRNGLFFFTLVYCRNSAVILHWHFCYIPGTEYVYVIYFEVYVIV